MKKILLSALMFAVVLIVAETSKANNQETHRVTVEVKNPEGHTFKSETLEIGETLLLTGLPSPMHLLNGAELLLPDGSISENIHLVISIPDRQSFEESDKNVGFGEYIANAISIEVYVNDENVSPYYFDKPIELTLPLPAAVKSGIGQDVSGFILAYRNEDGSIDTTGIRTVIRDAVKDYVKAEVEHFSTIIMLPEDKVQAENPFNVTISIKNPFGQIHRTDTLVAGDTLRFTGLPHPLLALNGGELYLPEQALAEDIHIEVSLPGFADFTNPGSDVSFGNFAANAVKMDVYINGEKVSPYEFEQPVELLLPIPDNIPAGFGEDISEFILAYRNDDGSIDTTGIRTVVRDQLMGYIKAEVDHFSTIILTNKKYADGTTTDVVDESGTLPVTYSLYQNYPNPFNPSTVIRFDLPGEEYVRLTVYDINGREIATLIDGTRQAGTHNVAFDASRLSSGVYIYRIESGSFSQSKLMTLIK